MKITSKVTTIEPPVSYTFPQLAKHTKTGLVILLIDEKEGTVVVADGEYHIGMHRYDWTCDSSNIWKVLPVGTKIEISVDI
jgi:hypothetical protein